MMEEEKADDRGKDNSGSAEKRVVSIGLQR